MPLGSALKKTNKQTKKGLLIFASRYRRQQKALSKQRRDTRGRKDFLFIWKKKKSNTGFVVWDVLFRDLSRPFFFLFLPLSFHRFSRGSMFPRRLAVVYAPPPSHLPARLSPVLLNTISQKFADVECGGIQDLETRQKQIDTRWGRQKGDWDPNACISSPWLPLGEHAWRAPLSNLVVIFVTHSLCQPRPISLQVAYQGDSPPVGFYRGSVDVVERGEKKNKAHTHTHKHEHFNLFLFFFSGTKWVLSGERSIEWRFPSTL